MLGLWQAILGSLKSLSRARRQFAFVAVVTIVLCLLTALTANHSSVMIQPKRHSLATPALPENLPLLNGMPGSEDDLKTRTEAAQSLVAGSLPRATYLPISPAEPRIAYSAE